MVFIPRQDVTPQAPGVFTFPTRSDPPAGIVERLAAGAVRGDYRRDERGVHTWTFPSPERFAACAAYEALAGPGRELVGGHAPGDAWSGADLPDALHMATVAGWPAAAALAMDVYDRLTAERLMSRIPAIHYQDEPGEDVDVSAYLAGEDAVFLATADTDRAVRGGRSAVRLRHSLFAGYDVSAAELVTKGIAAAAIVHLLEAAGVRVAVELDMSWSYGAAGSLVCVLKHYGEPADIPRLVYWLAHPSALRRVVFAVTSEHFETHYHRPVLDDEDVIRIGNAQYGGMDPAALVKSTLAKAGFELGA